jgi:mannose-1-phosphate guanylyltransferase
MRALVLAGGKGTRLRPLTDTRPKPLVPFMGQPFAAGLLARLSAAGCTEATFLVGDDPAPHAPLIEVGEQVGVAVAVEPEETPLDTAGAVRRVMARAEPGASVLVCNGDILTDLDYAALVQAHRTAGAAATLTLTRVADTSAFGVVVAEAGGWVSRFVEKPPPETAPADTVNAGTYVLSPGAFAGFPGDGPLSFEHDVFPGLLDSAAGLHSVVSDAYWQDLGTPARYLIGTRAVLEGRCEWPWADSLTRVGPSAAVDASAQLDSDVQLGAGVVIGAGCRVDAAVRLEQAVCFDGIQIGAGARVTRSILGEGVRVDPAAVVGPDEVVADGEHVTVAG